jgi:hypothetical protein
MTDKQHRTSARRYHAVFCRYKAPIRVTSSIRQILALACRQPVRVAAYRSSGLAPPRLTAVAATSLPAMRRSAHISWHGSGPRCAGSAVAGRLVIVVLAGQPLRPPAGAPDSRPLVPGSARRAAVPGWRDQARATGPGPAGRSVMTWIQVQDVRAAYARLTAAGVCI